MEGGGGGGGKNKNKKNQQLADELQKPVIRTLKKEKYIHHLNTIFRVLI